MSLKPEIRISYGYLLEPLFKRLFSLNPKNGDREFPTVEKMLSKTEACKASWNRYEEKIIRGMSDALGLEFYQDTVDVHTVFSRRSMSNPMVVGLDDCDEDRFIDVLTHELLHRLLTDNTKKVNVRKIWSEMFPDLDLLARNHMLVHAVHQHIYQNVLKEPSRMERDISKCAHSPSYKKSWDIVMEKGYMSIIDEFKNKHAA